MRRRRRPALYGMMIALVACVAGAVPLEDTLRMAREAGLAEVKAEPRSEGAGPDDYVVAVDFTATKPKGSRQSRETHA